MQSHVAIKSHFSALPRDEKEAFLLDLIHLLTIATRSSYDTSETDRFLKMRGMNEAIHLTAGMLRGMEQDVDAKPSDSFLDALFSKAGATCESEVEWAVRSAMERRTPKTKA